MIVWVVVKDRGRQVLRVVTPQHLRAALVAHAELDRLRAVRVWVYCVRPHFRPLGAILALGPVSK